MPRFKGRSISGESCLMSDEKPVTHQDYKSQLRKIAGKIDQFTTAHSIMRDSLRRKSGIISGITLFSSAAVTFLAIASDNIKEALLPNAVNSDYLLSTLAFVILCGSLAELQFKWRDRAAEHAEAASSFARLKLLFSREAALGADETQQGYVGLKTAYDNVCDMAVKLPDRQFIKLKAAHRRKIELSKYIDEHPHGSIWLTKLKLKWRDDRS